MQYLQPWILIACVLMAVGRFTVPGHGLSYAGTFEAVSHILVGMILTVIAVNPFCAAGKFYSLANNPSLQILSNEYNETRKFAFVCLLLVSILELVMALNVPKAGVA